MIVLYRVVERYFSEYAEPDSEAVDALAVTELASSPMLFLRLVASRNFARLCADKSTPLFHGKGHIGRRSRSCRGPIFDNCLFTGVAC